MDGGVAAGGDLVGVGEFLLGGGEADLQAFGFPGPALLVCLLETGLQVVADLDQPVALGWVGAQQGAADAPLTEPNPTVEFGVSRRWAA